jgi:hypothetical protein
MLVVDFPLLSPCSSQCSAEATEQFVSAMTNHHMLKYDVVMTFTIAEPTTRSFKRIHIFLQMDNALESEGIEHQTIQNESLKSYGASSQFNLIFRNEAWELSTADRRIIYSQNTPRDGAGVTVDRSYNGVFGRFYFFSRDNDCSCLARADTHQT